MTSLRSWRLLCPLLALTLLAASPCRAQDVTPPKVYIRVVVVACEGKTLESPEFQKEIEGLRGVIKDLNLTFKKYSLVKVHKLEADWKASVDVNFCQGRRLVITPLAFIKKRIRAVYQFFRVAKDPEGGPDKLSSIARMQQKSKDGATFVLAGGAIKADEATCNELLLVLTVQCTPFKADAKPAKD